MSEFLKRPTGQNPLVAAFRARMAAGADQPAKTGADLQRQYAEHFHTSVPPVQTQPSQLQRFSLTDPNIRTIVTSRTPTIG